MKSLAAIVLLLGGSAGAYAILKRPVEKAVRPPQKYTHVTRVEANHIGLLNFRLTGAPGRLHGQWTSTQVEKSAGLDSVLGAFSIKDPRGVVVHKAEAGATWGNFSVPVKMEGTYTVEMENKGPLRMTPRSVKVDATYELD